MDLFRDSDLKWIKEYGDEAIDFTEVIGGLGGQIAEAADGFVFRIFASQVNRIVSPRLPDSVKKELHDVFDHVKVQDYQTSLLELSDVAEVVIENRDIDPKVKPWLKAMIEIYKGIIEQLVPEAE